jgi:hypothetical protein
MKKVKTGFSCKYLYKKNKGHKHKTFSGLDYVDFKLHQMTLCLYGGMTILFYCTFFTFFLNFTVGFADLK